MEDFKKNPLFYSMQVALVVALLFGIFMAWTAYSAKATSERSLGLARSTNERLLKGHVLLGGGQDPVALTDTNLQAAQKDVADLTEHIAKLRASIAGNPEMAIRGKASANSAELYTVLKQSVDEWQKLAKEKDIKTPPADPCEFGFRRYIHNPGTSPKREFQRVDQQRQIIDFLFKQLVDARPAGSPLLLESVDREPIETFVLIPEGKPGAGTYAPDLEGGRTNESDEFKPERTFDRPGLIDALSFRVRFVGYTPTLRNFVNKIRNSGRPFGITSVEVRRAPPDLVKQLGTAPAPLVTLAPTQSAPAGAAGSLLFGNGAEEAATKPGTLKPAAPKDERRVAIEEVPSVFVVQIDYLSVIEVTATPPAEGETKK